jgi:hypothetical protein
MKRANKMSLYFSVVNRETHLGGGGRVEPPPSLSDPQHGLKLYRLNDENMTNSGELRRKSRPSDKNMSNSGEWRRKSRPSDKNIHFPDLHVFKIAYCTYT